MSARRPLKPTVALLFTALVLALPQVAMARFDEYPVHPVHLHFLAPAGTSSRLAPSSDGRAFGSDAATGAASGVLASALALMGARTMARRRGVRRSHPATAG